MEQFVLFPELEMTEKKSKKTQKRKKDYSKEEQDFQVAQTEWEKDKNNKVAWMKMFKLVNLAVFNNVNKKLEKVLSHDEIEQRSLDVTMNIMTGIIKKRDKNENWKIKKLSSFVHLPCLAIYSEKLKFDDKIKGEDCFITKDEKGNETIKESLGAYRQNGITFLSGDIQNENDISGILSEKALIETSIENCSRLIFILSNRLKIFRGEVPAKMTLSQNDSVIKDALVETQIALNTLRYDLDFNPEELNELTEKKIEKWNEIFN